MTAFAIFRSVSLSGIDPYFITSFNLASERATQIFEMEVAAGLEPTKIGFAGRRLDHFGIVFPVPLKRRDRADLNRQAPTANVQAWPEPGRGGRYHPPYPIRGRRIMSRSETGVGQALEGGLFLRGPRLCAGAATARGCSERPALP